MAEKIVNELKSLNFEQRGHEIYSDDDWVSFTNPNVPSIMDARMIAEKYNVELEIDHSWGIGTFYL